MNRLPLFFFVLTLFSVAVLAQQPEQGRQPPPQTDQMQQMQARMEAMREQMARIRAAEDPAERQRLMQEHMQTMHQGMGMMGQMMRRPMGQGRDQCPQGDNECRMNQMQMQHETMNQRMGMMHQMMEQMMQHMAEGQTSGALQAAPESDARD